MKIDAILPGRPCKLLDKIMGPEPVPEKKPARQKRIPGPPSKIGLTDELILEARAAYEFGGKTIYMIAKHYGWPYQKTYCLLDYQTRSKLYPTIDHLPEWAKDEHRHHH